MLTTYGFHSLILMQSSTFYYSSFNASTGEMLLMFRAGI